VTERMEAEAERRLLGAIVESSRDAIYGFTLDGLITSWNETAERLFGYDAAEAIGMSIAELVPPDLPDDTAMILERIPRGEVIEDRRTARIGKAGRHLDLSLTMSPVRDENRVVVGGSTIARDISDRKRSGRYMGAQHRVTAMLAHAPPVAEIGAAVLPMLAGSGDWTCALYWGAAEDRDELRCEASWTAPRLRGPILPVHEGTTCELQPNGNTTPDGEAVWVTDVAGHSPIPLGGRLAAAGMTTAVWTPLVADGRLWGGFALLTRESREPDEELLGVLSAIASQVNNYVERRYAEQKSDRVKNEFFSLISHELRTPLTSIIGYTDLIGETESDSLSDQGKDFLKVVRRNARRELRLVGDILLLTQIEAGTFRLVPEEADLKEIVDDAVSSSRLSAERQKVSLSSETQPVPGLWGDSSRLGQVVDNLLTNAIKFSPEGGEVGVKLGRQNGHALIEVSDTGMGIPPEDARRLFERLYRASGATDLHIPGTGLGLTIVKAIVDAHGGTIDVQSSEGCGTTFSVGLPIGAGEPHDENGQST
jgi:PAS domain S-box-containing protein